MDYKQAIEFIEGASGQGSKRGTANMALLLSRLGDPHKRLRAFHVAGTNGKGSICSMLMSALHAAGFSTGLYTSPHLERFNERIRLCGAPIADERLAQVTTRVAEQVERLRAEDVRPTFFEICTAVAFTFFAEEQVDYAVIEVGLGGEFDSTNVITPMVSVIASIGFDHMKTLGNTIEEIAAAKAGIIKPGVPVVVSPLEGSVRDVFVRRSAELGSPMTDLSQAGICVSTADGRGSTFSLNIGGQEWRDVRINLSGEHQVRNAACALAALSRARESGLLSITDAQIRAGLGQARWPGRLEWIEESPALLLDGAHNAQGAAMLADYVRAHLNGRRVVLMMGMMGDKPVGDVTALLAGIADAAVATQVEYHRAMAAAELAALLSARGLDCRTEPDVAKALDTARGMAGEGGVVLVAGSLYLVGAVRELLGVDDGSI